LASKNAQRTSINNRDSYNNKKKDTSLSKENYYYHSTSQHNSNNNNTGHNQSKEKSSWMRSQKGKSFYGEKYDKYEKEKYLDRTYTAAQNVRRK
jgi:hypothetical protein